MSEYRNQILIGGVVAAVVGIVLVASIAYLPLASTTTVSTTTSSSGGKTETTQHVSTYSTIASSGLELEILMNTTSFQPDQNLSLQIALVNTLKSNLALPVNWSSNTNIPNWDFNDSLCGISTVQHTFGFAIFQGHYNQANLSEAQEPLMLAAPVAEECPNVFANQGYIQNVAFQPQSHSASFYANASYSGIFKPITGNMLINASTGSCETSPYFANGTTIQNGSTTTSSGTSLSFGCGAYGNVLNGYWAMPASGYLSPNMRTNSTIMNFMNSLYQNYFHPFSPGSYTVVAEDLWNQTVFAYFEVTQPA